MPASSPRSGVRRRDWTGLAVFVGFALVAFVELGVRLLLDPGREYLGYGADPKAFIWCFGWWPYAILHGVNPFVTRALWAPGGVNLVWTTSVPGLALLFAPLTLAAGPVVSYNVATILLPALAAWSAFALCRWLTRAVWPSLVGGYLFGFSSYVLGQEEGHPHMTAVFLVPLVALVLARFVVGELSARGTVVRLGPLLGLELLISTEVTFTLGLAILVGVVLGLVFLPDRRGRLVALLPPLAAAGLVAACLTAPFVYYAVTGFQRSSFNPPVDYVSDLLNFVVPTKLSLVSLGWARSISQRFPGNDSERGAYVGVPVLVIVALFGWRRMRTATGRFLLAGLVVAVVCSLGFRLTIDGHRSAWLPWSLVGRLPLFDNVLPERLSMYVALVTALIVALWTAARPAGLGRWLLPGIAVVALLPNPAAGVWASRFSVPRFFTDSAYRSCLRPGETILPLPISAQSESMLWQVSDGFRFRMAGGHIAPSPPERVLSPQWIARVAEGEAVPADRVGELRTYIRVEGVTSVVVDPRFLDEWAGALDRLASPRRIGGVVVYHFSRGASACTRG